MKNRLGLLLFLIIASCSTQPYREPGSIGLAGESCRSLIHFLIDDVPHARAKALAFIEEAEQQGLAVHIDVGGEGRYLDAININPGRYTSTTGEAGRTIPRHIYGLGQDLPIPDRAVDQLTLENTPLNGPIIEEILRVMRPRGKIRLSHPRDYADSAHLELIERLGERVDEVVRTFNPLQDSVESVILLH
ncbi:MAG: hypothetical protein HOM21_12085 [Halobacteriovoraceae bacterium]|nr:hypothetical protein [Halobacteriovoraceae bacterium]